MQKLYIFFVAFLLLILSCGGEDYPQTITICVESDDPLAEFFGYVGNNYEYIDLWVSTVAAEYYVTLTRDSDYAYGYFHKLTHPQSELHLLVFDNDDKLVIDRWTDGEDCNFIIFEYP